MERVIIGKILIFNLSPKAANSDTGFPSRHSRGLEDYR